MNDGMLSHSRKITIAVSERHRLTHLCGAHRCGINIKANAPIRAMLRRKKRSSSICAKSSNRDCFENTFAHDAPSSRGTNVVATCPQTVTLS